MPVHNKKKVMYVVDEKRRKRFPPPLFRTVTTIEVVQSEVEKFRKRNGRLPEHVKAIELDHE